MTASEKNEVSAFFPQRGKLGLAEILVSVLLLAVGSVPTKAETPERRPSGPAFAISESGARALEVRASAAEPRTIVVPFDIAAEDAKPDDTKKGQDKDPEAVALPPQTPAPELSPAQQYCSSILDTATAAQIAQQTRNLQKAQKQLDDRIALLAAKADVLKNWIKLREDFTTRATDSLVKIYSKMKPDAAAGQLAIMDEEAAAAIMSKLAPKVSSQIMTEMEAAKAARLAAIMVGAGEIAVQPQPERKADVQ
jgi:flagellar motility protein MotE (MotC chaperone)